MLATIIVFVLFGSNNNLNRIEEEDLSLNNNLLVVENNKIKKLI